MSILSRLFVLVAMLVSVACSKFEDATLSAAVNGKVDAAVPERAAIEYNPDRNLLWGDLHVHTALSYDAFTVGTRAMPDDAYTYMKGGTIQHAFGYPIRAHTPLDFGAVTDHVEYLGVPRYLAGEDRDALDQQAIALLKEGSALKYSAYYLYRIFTQMASAETREETFGRDDLRGVSESAWQEIVDAAERHNHPGHFTTFIAYEWSSMPNERNLHRNVIYESTNVPDFPFSSRDSENPEDLWRALDKQRAAGMSVLAIPHNGNVSGGLMYSDRTFDGEPLTADYAAMRNRNEPLTEIFQIKGSSETHPQLSPKDPFAGFEIMDTIMSTRGEPSQPRGSYARDALRTGLEFAHSEQFNPYRFGVIGSSDSHNASSPVEEDNYHGKLPLLDGTPAQRSGQAFVSDRIAPMKAYGAAGLVAVWAEENTREAIFRAMQRKETYATSGPRIVLRFFAGWGYSQLQLEPGWLAAAYAGGVPMGGTLTAAEDGSPTFVVVASRDPIGANLDRLQIIKVWVDSDGRSQEKVIDVAASDNRMSAGGSAGLPAVGSTVDVDQAAYSNTIGSPELTVIWKDPEYDPSQEALYYARAIEIPTPRYSTYDAKAMSVEAPEPTAIQERAVSSAIWIAPTG